MRGVRGGAKILVAMVRTIYGNFEGLTIERSGSMQGPKMCHNAKIVEH